jgi:hypothetical protein
MANFVDRTGEISGKLKILHIATRKGELLKWTVQCSGCQIIKNIDTAHFKLGEFRKCDCRNSPHRVRNEIKIGNRYNRLVVDSFVGIKNNRKYWNCICDCGNQKHINTSQLNRGLLISCGCYSAEIRTSIGVEHRECFTRLYGVWSGMKNRCGGKNCGNYHSYGGRGISVTTAWHDYIKFRDWALANGYKAGLTIERVDVNGNYEPSNCTWIPLKEQAKNTTKTVRLIAFGETKTLLEWLYDPRCAVGEHALRSRIRMGWTPETAITTPSREKKNPKPLNKIGSHS